MLVNQKPQRMAFTIENLAKSSREESFPEVPLTFPNLPPIGFAPRLQLLDNCTPIKLQATVIPSMSTPKTNSKRKRNHSEVSDTESTTSSRSKSTSEESSESFGAFISGMYHSISIVKKSLQNSFFKSTLLLYVRACVKAVVCTWNFKHLKLPAKMRDYLLYNNIKKMSMSFLGIT